MFYRTYHDPYCLPSYSNWLPCCQPLDLTRIAVLDLNHIVVLDHTVVVVVVDLEWWGWWKCS